MYYIFAQEFMRKYANNTKLMIVANDHALIPLAFAGAARTQRRKTAYIQHAHVTENFPRLRFDLCILDGRAAHEIYEKITPAADIRQTAFVYRGTEGVERPMEIASLTQNQKDLTIGVFINVFEEPVLQSLILSLSGKDNIKSILIRPHPAHPITINFLSPKVKVSVPRTPLLEDAQKCDLIIGGNSSFHLSVLKYGIPSLYWDNLDYILSDYYGFVAGKILYEIKDPQNLDLPDIYSFYKNENWASNFQKFDASYLRSNNNINIAIRNAILNLS
jgi:hypothetical protein